MRLNAFENHNLKFHELPVFIFHKQTFDNKETDTEY